MTVSYKKRQVDHWSTVENPEIHPIFIGHYFLPGCKENIMGTKTVLSTNGDMKTHHTLKNEVDHFIPS